MLSWLHIGDLHFVRDGDANVCDLRRIVMRVMALGAGGVDFVLLPGDNADDGTDEQFALVRELIAPLTATVHILPGDHDNAHGDLRAFYETLGARRLPYAETIDGVRCVFLDQVSAGSGGLDFRMDTTQLDWLDERVTAAERVAVFMHTYPADLNEGGDRLRAMLGREHVLAVDMGHTHYNELANDGGTIFMATRSTGQVEEGPVGSSIAAIDGSSVSWRFKAVEDAWPFVLITSPADRRLSFGPPTGDRLRARVIGDVPIVSVECHGGDAWHAMTATGDPAVWEAEMPENGTVVRVRATDARGRTDEDRIETGHDASIVRAADGSDRDAVGAWPEKGILGTQLGPNRNGRAW